MTVTSGAETTATETVEPPEHETTETTTPDTSAEVEKWKALARKNESRAKENAEKAKRLDELEEAQKSAEQKAAEKQAQLERENADLRADKLRSDIAREKGVAVELLTGNDEETLNAQADAALAWKGSPPAAPSSDGQGKQGEPLGDGVKQLTDSDLESMTPEQINKARREGRLNKLLGITT